MVIKNKLMVLFLFVLIAIPLLSINSHQEFDVLLNASDKQPSDTSFNFIYPNENTVWEIGKCYVIHWETIGFVPLVNVSMFHDDSEILIIDRELENVGFCDVCIRYFHPNSSRFRIFIEDAYDGVPNAFSEYFSIINPYDPTVDGNNNSRSPLIDEIIMFAIIISLLALIPIIRKVLRRH